MAEVELDGRYGRLYGFLEWPVRLVVLNLLWIVGVLAGLVVAGLAPATLALYTLLRDYLQGKPVRAWRDFWTTWRRTLPSSQLVLGMPLLTVVVVVFYLIASRGTPFAVATTVLAIGYIATLLQLPAAVTHLDLGVTDTWKTTIAIAWRQPLQTVGAAIVSVFLLVGAWFIAPAALPLLFPALPALLATLVVRRGVRELSELSSSTASRER
ncbi:YesL family protein [Phytoactinopolyspora endophytica]|uniref:YesL family protein n=1 Tax=Phytoactinopolyspora endophytica TaxID=1642495 RepID=UPI00101C7FFC|nr:DUF624 domain-containing protein [Phytoactinopolyspora endophytica]